MSDPNPQPLLTRRPIVCTRCMHGHLVEVITDRMNSPVEYHCGFCGNYAIVGVEAKWPFLEVVKGNSSKPLESGSGGHPRVDEKKGSETGSSPMQVGESLQGCKSEKEEPMPKKRCSVPGCEKQAWLKGMCHKHYTERYGVYVPEKKGNGVVLPKKEPAAKPPASAVTGIPATEKDEPIPLFRIFLDPELLDALTAAAKKEYRTPELHAAYLIDRAVREG